MVLRDENEAKARKRGGQNEAKSGKRDRNKRADHSAPVSPRLNSKTLRTGGDSTSTDLTLGPVNAAAPALSDPPGASSPQELSLSPQLRLTYEAVEDLTFFQRGIRKHSRRQRDKLRASIQKFGFVIPVVISANKRVVVGEARLKAARDLGLTHVPCICVDHLSEDELRQLRVADNRLQELGEWEEVNLRLELADLAIRTPDLNLEAMGFEIPEFDLIMLDPPGPMDPADNTPTVIGPSFITQGDIFWLGRHSLVCGDARDDATYRRLLSARLPHEEGGALGRHERGGTVRSAKPDGDLVVRPSVVFADPPYDLKANMVGGGGRTGPRPFIMGSGELGEGGFLRFQGDWLKCAAKVLAPGGLVYSASDWRILEVTVQAGKAADLELINICVWTKQNAGMGSFYRSGHELVCVMRKPGAPHRNNVLLGQYGRNRSNVWTYPGANGFGPARKDLDLHPTVKPVALVADILLDCTARGDVVVDPFSGSGSTLLAAERTGRTARAIELDPHYVEVALRRFERLHGVEAIHADTGLTLNELVAQRQRDAHEHERGDDQGDPDGQSKSLPRDPQRASADAGSAATDGAVRPAPPRRRRARQPEGV